MARAEIAYSGHRHGPGPLQQYRHENAEGEAEDRSFHGRIRSLIKTPLQSRRRCMASKSNSSSPTLTNVNFTHETPVSGRRIDVLADPPLGSTAVERRTEA
jgi:hypothetical protein